MLKMVAMIVSVGHRQVTLLVLGAGESMLVLGKLRECRGNVYLVVYVVEDEECEGKWIFDGVGDLRVLGLLGEDRVWKKIKKNNFMIF